MLTYECEGATDGVTVRVRGDSEGAGTYSPNKNFVQMPAR